MLQNWSSAVNPAHTLEQPGGGGRILSSANCLDSHDPGLDVCPEDPQSISTASTSVRGALYYLRELLPRPPPRAAALALLQQALPAAFLPAPDVNVRFGALAGEPPAWRRDPQRGGRRGPLSTCGSCSCAAEAAPAASAAAAAERGREARRGRAVTQGAPRLRCPVTGTAHHAADPPKTGLALLAGAGRGAAAAPALRGQPQGATLPARQRGRGGRVSGGAQRCLAHLVPEDGLLHQARVAVQPHPGIAPAPHRPPTPRAPRKRKSGPRERLLPPPRSPKPSPGTCRGEPGTSSWLQPRGLGLGFSLRPRPLNPSGAAVRRASSPQRIDAVRAGTGAKGVNAGAWQVLAAPAPGDSGDFPAAPARIKDAAPREPPPEPLARAKGSASFRLPARVVQRSAHSRPARTCRRNFCFFGSFLRRGGHFQGSA